MLKLYDLYNGKELPRNKKMEKLLVKLIPLNFLKRFASNLFLPLVQGRPCFYSFSLANSIEI